MINRDKIKDILFESQMRWNNRVLAIQLGIFGKTAKEIDKNMSIYSEAEEKKVDDNINTINKLLRR